MGGELLEGAELVLDVTRFDERAAGAALVVTGEGTVDATTFEGKAPGAVLRRCKALGVRCELFGGIVEDGFDAHALSGRRALAGEDLVQLGEELALAALDLA
jgi:glycerate kinase